MKLIKKNHHRIVIIAKIISMPLKEGTKFTSTEIQQQSHRNVKTKDSRITKNFQMSFL